jgi:hypothetical protein
MSEPGPAHESVYRSTFKDSIQDSPRNRGDDNRAEYHDTGGDK